MTGKTNVCGGVEILTPVEWYGEALRFDKDISGKSILIFASEQIGLTTQTQFGIAVSSILIEHLPKKDANDQIYEETVIPKERAAVYDDNTYTPDDVDQAFGQVRFARRSSSSWDISVEAPIFASTETGEGIAYKAIVW